MARGFDLFNYWYKLYRDVTNKSLPPLNSISIQGKIQFHGRLGSLKTAYHWGVQDIKSLMLFALMHDPLKLPVEQYGNVQNLISSAKHFQAWRRLYYDSIPEYRSEPRAIYATAPTGEKQRFDVDPMVLEQLEAFELSAA